MAPPSTSSGRSNATAASPPSLPIGSGDIRFWQRQPSPGGSIAAAGSVSCPGDLAGSADGGDLFRLVFQKADVVGDIGELRHHTVELRLGVGGADAAAEQGGAVRRRRRQGQ